ALAMHPDCAARYAELMIGYFGIADPSDRLKEALTGAYLAHKGDIRILLRVMTASAEFWSDASRWQLIKSPVHLAVGACRSLDLAAGDIPALDAWLQACGHSLMDAPSRGAEPWPTGRDWLIPEDRLAARYQLANTLLRRSVSWGMQRDQAASKAQEPQLPAWLRNLDSKRAAPDIVAELSDRLDPAPGLSLESLVPTLEAKQGAAGIAAVLQQILASAEYQLA
ncbi:MAG: DUF1800 family protein, partial [Pseudomonadota bacterium]